MPPVRHWLLSYRKYRMAANALYAVGRNMLPAETRYSTNGKEALAIFYAFKKFDSYLRYAHTTLYRLLVISINFKRPVNPVSPRIARYVYALTAYENDIVYGKGA